MARKLQHITTKDLIETAGQEGTKVRALCGKRIYAMTNMKAEIPTCTPCSRVVLAEINEYRSRGVATFTWTSSNTWVGGAA